MTPQSFGAQIFGLHPQRLAMPPPPHVAGAAQLPQLSMPPHPLGTSPQLAPRAEHVTGVHPHLFGTPPPPHRAGATHVPQFCTSPHPSETKPHSAPTWAQVHVEQPSSSQKFGRGVPRGPLSGLPQVESWPRHVPQKTVPPHSSDIVPQLAPRAAQVVGVHPQRFGTPLPPQVSGAAQEPHASVPPQRSEMVPHSTPIWAQVVGLQPHR
jgi:hypothetical protein